ncbi:MAG: Invasion associated locus B family protein [Candidatus Tokpelaia sp. JSC085]|nr:MAG: Invasion associated locus B family protein [Candidatus Tokpelaia sp. JSC085]
MFMLMMLMVFDDARSNSTIYLVDAFSDLKFMGNYLMMMKEKYIFFILAGALSLLLAVCTSASAQSMMQGWYKVCKKQQDQDVCNTMNNVVSDTGQYLTMVNLVEVVGKQKQRRIGVQVPTGRLILEGIKISVDGGRAKVIPYVICDGPTCIANDVLDDTLVNAMKKGKALMITSVNFQGIPNPIEIPLQGFLRAFSGPGMREQDLQAAQEKLQQAVQSKQKAIEDRMRIEQQKAKAGN